MDISALDQNFGVAGRISFAAGPGGLPLAELKAPSGTAGVLLQGGQVLRYEPRHQPPVLWVSREAAFAPGKAVRGGIPVCWPWFGPHPLDKSKPSHGFARTRNWEVVTAKGLDDGAAFLELGLRDAEETRAIWPHAFELRLRVTLGAELRVELAARNTGKEPFTCGGALHSYFAVSDVAKVAVHGLDGAAYLDQLDGLRRKVQRGPVTVQAETDRIYVDTGSECVIEDTGRGRRIRIAKWGSRSTVVWNPWIEKARRLTDFGDGEYPGMLCVETANAGDDTATLAPGAEHGLGLVLRAEPRP